MGGYKHCNKHIELNMIQELSLHSVTKSSGIHSKGFFFLIKELKTIKVRVPPAFTGSVCHSEQRWECMISQSASITSFIITHFHLSIHVTG